MRNRHVVYPVRIVLEQFVWQSAFLTVIDEDDTHIVEVDVPLQSQHVEERLSKGKRTLIVGDDQVETSRINLSLPSFGKYDPTTAVHIVFR